MRRSDAGLTLVELLAATAITALIAPVLAGVFVVGYRTTDSTVVTLSENRNRQIGPSLFTQDVQAATTVATGGAQCTRAGDTLLVRLGRSETPASGPAVDRQVAWVHTSSSRLERLECDGAGSVLSSVSAAHDVTATPTLSCTDAGGAATPCGAAVALALQVVDAAGSFAVTGTRRAG